MKQATAFTLEIEFFKLTFKKSEASTNAGTQMATVKDRVAVLYEDDKGETRVDVRSMRDQVKFWRGILGVEHETVKGLQKIAFGLFPDLFPEYNKKKEISEIKHSECSCPKDHMTPDCLIKGCAAKRTGSIKE